MKVTLALLLLTLPLAAGEPPAGTIQLHAAKVEWKATKPPLPAGTELAVLEGDPKQPGMFTIRLRIPKTTVIQITTEGPWTVTPVG